MKTPVVLALVIACVGCREKTTKTEIVRHREGMAKILHVAFGESNAGGYALNSNAESWEIAARAELQMWNVTTDVFEDLDIGTNNNLDHSGLDSTTHGWELGLANRIRQGHLPDNNYYLQTGQGASLIADWAVGAGSGYWTEFLSRTAAVNAALTYDHCIVWLSLGINDAIAGSPISNATYKSGIEDLITRIEAELPGCKFMLFTLPPVNSTYNGYSAQLRLIAAADSGIEVVEWDSAVAMRDTNHASYLGMRRLAARGVYGVKSLLGRQPVMLPWSAYYDADTVVMTAINNHAHNTTVINILEDGYIGFELTQSDGMVVAIDEGINAVNWSAGSDSYLGAGYAYAGSVYASTANGTGTAALTTTPCWGRLRWTAGGSDLLFETSTDGGDSWTLRYTFSGVLTGKATARVKVLSAVGAASMTIWKSPIPYPSPAEIAAAVWARAGRTLTA